MESKTVLKWQPAEQGWAPKDSWVKGGSDVNGEMTFVGRAFVAGEVLPGKVVPSHKVCYVAHGGKELGCDEFQVLETVDEAEVVWYPSANGEVPPGVVQGGASESGEPSFVGRAQHEGAAVVGRIDPRQRLLLTSFGGEEKSYSEYEALCVKCVSF